MNQKVSEDFFSHYLKRKGENSKIGSLLLGEKFWGRGRGEEEEQWSDSGWEKPSDCCGISQHMNFAGRKHGQHHPTRAQISSSCREAGNRHGHMVNSTELPGAYTLTRRTILGSRI